MAEQTGERGGGARIQIVVALISLLGVVSAAALGNWDLLFPPRVPTGAASPLVPSVVAPPAPAPPIDEMTALAEAQRRALAGSADALNAVADRIDAAGAGDPAGAASVDRSGKSP